MTLSTYSDLRARHREHPRRAARTSGVSHCWMSDCRAEVRTEEALHLLEIRLCPKCADRFWPNGWPFPPGKPKILPGPNP